MEPCAHSDWSVKRSCFIRGHNRPSPIMAPGLNIKCWTSSALISIRWLGLFTNRALRKHRKLIFPDRDFIICIVPLEIFHPHFSIRHTPQSGPHFTKTPTSFPGPCPYLECGAGKGPGIGWSRAYLNIHKNTNV